MGEIRLGLGLDIQKQTKLMAEIKRKLAEP
jgi:hypothetical protein